MHHPEMKKEEVFVGNTDTGGVPQYLIKRLETARVGGQAYDIYGKKLSPDHHMLPLFIGRSEELEYDRIMCSRGRS